MTGAEGIGGNTGLSPTTGGIGLGEQILGTMEAGLLVIGAIERRWRAVKNLNHEGQGRDKGLVPGEPITDTYSGLEEFLPEAEILELQAVAAETELDPRASRMLGRESLLTVVERSLIQVQVDRWEDIFGDTFNGHDVSLTQFDYDEADRQKKSQWIHFHGSARYFSMGKSLGPRPSGGSIRQGVTVSGEVVSASIENDGTLELVNGQLEDGEDLIAFERMNANRLLARHSWEPSAPRTYSPNVQIEELTDLAQPQAA